MVTMIVATPTPRARTATATVTVIISMATIIATAFNVPLFQIYHQIHLKMNHPINQMENEKGNNLYCGDNKNSRLSEAKIPRNREVKVCFLPGAKTEDLMFNLIP